MHSYQPTWLLGPVLNTESITSDLCIAIYKPNIERPKQFHSGIIYKKITAFRFLHLAFHKNLQEDDYPTTSNRPHFLVPVDVDSIRLEVILSQLAHIYEPNKDSLAYATGIPLLKIDQVSGAIELQDGALGLTCASFIACVFETLGLSLIVPSEWPPRRTEDIKWLWDIATWISRSDLGHYWKMLWNPDSRRIRPQEIAAAASSPSLPATFQYCDHEGRRAAAFLTLEAS